MKLAVSNIAWGPERDGEIFRLMRDLGYSGLEIAPTRVFPERPYDRLEEAAAWAGQLRREWGFTVPSMQSIWFGRGERLFGSPEERAALTAYTKRAVDFAAAIGCRNLVFGCPKNRSLPEGADPASAIPFFRELGAYAAERGCVIGMEANPLLYNTNYINGTAAALELIGQVASPGFGLNLDLGTVLANRESLALLRGRVREISHVHISEPGLKPLEDRELHRELRHLLEAEGYAGFVSIEMGRQEELFPLKKAMEAVRALFPAD